MIEWRSFQDRRKGILPWRPESASTLIGVFVGSLVITGTYGPYNVLVVDIPVSPERSERRTISGSRVDQFLKLVNAPLGRPIRVQFRGWVEIGEGRKLRDFEIDLADPVPVGELLEYMRVNRAFVPNRAKEIESLRRGRRPVEDPTPF
tara:strand:+ start:2447 stop:2890 length:444 start_codon:yes stop_codon:yes gene_type:complete